MKTSNVSIDPKDALKDRYKIRAVGPGSKYYEVALPRQVVEREAERHDLTPSEFCAQFEMEALYNSFEGVHYRFVRREV